MARAACRTSLEGGSCCFNRNALHDHAAFDADAVVAKGSRYRWAFSRGLCALEAGAGLCSVAPQPAHAVWLR